MTYYIRGVGLTKVGEHWERNLISLAVEASKKAIEHAGINPKNIDKILVANAAAPYLLNQSHLGPYLADYLGLSGVPVIGVDLGNAAGAAAIHMGLREIAAGAENVLVVGVEKLSDNLSKDVIGAVALEQDWEFLTALGVTSEAIQGILARMYMSRYNAPHENIAMMSVVSHNHAAKSPHAMYPFPTKIESVLKSPLFADPLRMLEIAGRGDGAAALVLSGSDGDVIIKGSSIRTDKYRVYEREDPLFLRAVNDAAQDVFTSANISHKDINVLELHDTTSIMGVLELEALGFAEKGAGHQLLGDGQLNIDGGSIPSNTFGGSKARGDPLGATGVYQAVEIYKQLIGEAGSNQVDGAKYGLSVTISGIASSAVVNLFSRRD